MSELDHYLQKWNLTLVSKIDYQSDFSNVYVVERFNNKKAVLKIPQGKGIEGERLGATTLKYFDGHGAVTCLAHENHVQLLDFIDGPMLISYVDDGHDDEATRIICDVVKKLHVDRQLDIPELKPLRQYFKELFDQAEKSDVDSHYQWAAELVENLLATASTEKLLHGDIHHENIMHSADKGWIVIDPKGIYGDPHYDVANCFNNPPGHDDLVKNPDRINRMADIFSQELGYDRQRLLQFACAYMALSSSWHLTHDAFARAHDSLENSKIVRSILES